MVTTDLGAHAHAVTTSAAPTREGLGRLPFARPLLEARRVLEAQPSGTLRLRANDVECRALEDTGMVVAFALSHGPGM